MHTSLASYTRALGLVSWVSFSLKSRLHCLFQQNSYCQGVQCACFSKDDKYVYAGLKDRSIIVWSVLDGESFCFESKAKLRSGEEGPVLGPGHYSAPLWPSSSWFPPSPLPSKATSPPGATAPLLDPCSGDLGLQNTLPTCLEHLSASFPRPSFWRWAVPQCASPGLREWPWVVSGCMSLVKGLHV